MDTYVVTQQLEQQSMEVAQSPKVHPWVYWVAGALALFAMGTWLVWFSAYVQRKFVEDDVRAACRRIMPETADRCFDTVVIQRGGVRR